MSRLPTETARQRCHHHPAREASARCPECKRPCCRECVTEHDGKVLCSDCLRKRAERARSSSRSRAILLTAIGALFGLATAWLFFALAGEALLSIPTAVHEGAIFHPELEEP